MLSPNRGKRYGRGASELRCKSAMMCADMIQTFVNNRSKHRCVNAAFHFRSFQSFERWPGGDVVAKSTHSNKQKKYLRFFFMLTHFS